MKPEDIKRSLIKAYPPSYVKDKVKQYVNSHKDMSVSEFTTEALKEHLIRVGFAPNKTMG